MNDVDVVSDSETIVRTKKPAPAKKSKSPKPKPQPQYNLIVLNDELHTYDYVIEALVKICGHSAEQAFRLAFEIDATGRAIVWTGNLELAELKRDQIREFGPDLFGQKIVTFPLGCYIEPLA